MKSLLTIHGVIAAIWLTLAMVLCLKIAFLGNEEKAIGAQRGRNDQERRDLTSQIARARSDLDHEASAPALEESIHRLGLPLSPPQMAER